MADSQPLPPRPDLTIKIADREIKMTYGLEMDIRRMLPDPVSALHLVQQDAFTQDYVVRRVLTDKAKMIVDESELIAHENVDIDGEDVQRILSWALEHTLYFFMKRTVEMARLGVQYQQALPKLSTDGSANSASTTPSAGPSE